MLQAKLGLTTVSPPLKELQRKFGFEGEHIISIALELLGRN